MSKVYLVGGGPGSAQLLTLRGKQVLEQADCVLYDRLLEADMLEFTRADCERIYVGKRAGHASLTQEEIQTLLIEKAKQHACVVRLKGGDAYIFGRGGEEVLALVREGIPFEVVPGVSSFSAAALYAGIPLTHRGIARGFRVMSAYDKEQQMVLDFASMANSEDTCVFLMGLSRVRLILEGLRQAGKAKTTPAAIISHASWADQRSLYGTIETLADQLEEDPLPSPAVLVVGACIALHTKLSFFEQRPLHGKCVVLASPQKRSAVCAKLRELGAKVIQAPTGEICLHGEALEGSPLSAYTHIVMTSRHSVEALLSHMRKHRLDARCLAKTKLCCIGEKTAELLNEHLLFADIVPSKSSAKELLKELEKELHPKDQVLFLSGKVYDEALKQGIKRKAQLTQCIVYENRLQKAEQEMFSQADAAIFTCSSAVAMCSHSLTKKELPVIAIGEQTAETLRHHGMEQILIAPVSSMEGCVETLLSYWQRKRKDEEVCI